MTQLDLGVTLTIPDGAVDAVRWWESLEGDPHPNDQVNLTRALRREARNAARAFLSRVLYLHTFHLKIEAMNKETT